MPLHVFESRYRRLVSDLQRLPADERRFGIIAIKDGVDVGTAGAKALYSVGTTAEVTDITTLPDGRSALAVVGGTRFRLREVERATKPYLLGHVDYLPEDPGPTDGYDSDALVVKVITAYRAYRDAIGPWVADDESPQFVATDPDLLSYLVASTTVLDLAERQRLLEIDTTRERLRQALQVLRREAVMTQVLQSLPSSDFARIDVSTN